MIAFATIAMQAKGTFTHQNKVQFNTYSEPIGIDNRCTGCISHKIEDFDGPLVKSTRAVKGFGGSRTSDENRYNHMEVVR
jgi:Ni,Fe-hydrogenase I small subunit